MECNRPYRRRWTLLVSVIGVALMVAGCGGERTSQPPLDENLLDNPGAESGDESHGALDGWKEGACFSGLEYGSQESELDAAPSEIDSPGSWHFAGGNQLCNDVATGQQVVRNVDQLLQSNETVEYQMSGWLGGVGSDRDYATFVAWFYGPNGSLVGADAIGPVTVEERSSQTTLARRTADGIIPSRTSRIELVLMLKKYGGDHHGYAENLSFVLTGS